MMKEQEYRDLSSEKYFSYSLLSSVYMNGPQVLVEKDDISNLKGIRWGKVAHLLLFEEDSFDDKYKVLKYTESLTKTFETLKNDIMIAHESSAIDVNDIKNETNKYISTCFDIVSDKKLWNNIKDKKLLVEKFKDETLINTLLELIENIDDPRDFISTTDFMNIKLVVKTLREHEFTTKYFKKQSPKDIQVLFEIPILYKFLKKDFKSMLDIILIDHKEKTLQVIDFKTGVKKHDHFIKSFFEWRYDIQAALYSFALTQFRKEQNLKGYTIQEPLYVYISRNELEKPYVYRISKSTLDNAIAGYYNSYGKKIKGVIELLEDIEFYRKEQRFDYEADVIRNKGITVIEPYSSPRITSVPSEFNDVFNYQGSLNELEPELNRFDVNVLRDTLADMDARMSRRERRSRTGSIQGGWLASPPSVPASE